MYYKIRSYQGREELTILNWVVRKRAQTGEGPAGSEEVCPAGVYRKLSQTEETSVQKTRSRDWGWVCARLLEENGELPWDFQKLEGQGNHGFQFN